MVWNTMNEWRQTMHFARRWCKFLFLSLHFAVRGPMLWLGERLRTEKRKEKECESRRAQKRERHLTRVAEPVKKMVRNAKCGFEKNYFYSTHFSHTTDWHNVITFIRLSSSILKFRTKKRVVGIVRTWSPLCCYSVHFNRNCWFDVIEDRWDRDRPAAAQKWKKKTFFCFDFVHFHWSSEAQKLFANLQKMKETKHSKNRRRHFIV